MKESSPSQEENFLSPKQVGSPLQNLLYISLLALMGWGMGAGHLQAQELSNDSRFRMMKDRAESNQFYQLQQTFAQGKESERARIPQYNVDLSLTLSRFHQHISDMHHRHVTCSICREHVKKIKQLAKKIDQGMK